MKDVKHNLVDETEPTVRHGMTFISMWLIGLLGLLVYWAFGYINVHGGDYQEQVYEPYHSTNQLASFLPKDPTMILFKIGEQVYRDRCLNCHQANGLGNPVQAPPLAGSEWVLAPGGPNRLIRIPIRGLTGPIRVKEVDYNLGSMAAIGADLSDDQIAGVLTYIRSSWGNKAPMVTPEQVAKVRQAIANHPDMFTPEELLKLPEQIP
jgi:mono/diheme cytochrome c family protein